MSRRSKQNGAGATENADSQSVSMPSDSRNDVQNAPPPKRWSNLDHFWHSSVKNGTPLLFESFKVHLRCMGWLDDQSKWVTGAQHFGIPVEK